MYSNIGLSFRWTLPLTQNIFLNIQTKTFFPHIGQYGYQKTQNFMLIPNLKMKLRKSALIKSYFKNWSKKQFFDNNFLTCVFFNFAFGFGISVKFCIFWYPYWPISRTLIWVTTPFKTYSHLWRRGGWGGDSWCTSRQIMSQLFNYLTSHSAWSSILRMFSPWYLPTGTYQHCQPSF